MDNWFDSAKLGIFMHWGIYSVLGVTESWSFFGNEIGYDEYMNQLNGFTAKKYNPDEWAELFKKAGARYAVLTSKHHDGVALWDTKTTDLNVVKKTPAKRDLVAPYCEAMRNHGLKVGLYIRILTGISPIMLQYTRKAPNGGHTANIALRPKVCRMIMNAGKDFCSFTNSN